MANKVEQMEQSLADLVKANDAELTTEAIKAYVHKKHGYDIANNPKTFREKAEEYRLQKTADLNLELSKLQARFQGGVNELEAKITRQKVMATNGNNIVNAYAKQQMIDTEKAAQELQEYAKRKAGRFTDILPDRYAALALLPTLKDEDRKYADSVLEKELKAYVDTDAEAELNFYKSVATLHPARLADLYRGTDWANRRLFAGKFKS